MNIWHDISKSRIQPEKFIACIEISKGSKKKYELDKETGMIIGITMMPSLEKLNGRKSPQKK